MIFLRRYVQLEQPVAHVPTEGLPHQEWLWFQTAKGDYRQLLVAEKNPSTTPSPMSR